ncbi:di-heme oxidoreductase family protein [Cupriavidus pauculus]|uniref:Thiol oxidoreductase n=1 Tax=Cupriavidus pauculus TaxID=82633 RepID=A0A2N5CE45_9BURK|nr:di-heme oxidoredictase family protein [Cupriavidus pauculus]PLQ00520.1 thiol oxidoreductase [Cupriavidus pauculus]
MKKVAHYRGPALLLAVISMLAACGGGGDGSPPPPTVAPSLYEPLYSADTPVMEQIQYREADGTLVTMMGSRPTERHARERGEAWDAPDAGPGRYLTFPTFYFQNRTFGLEIRDHVPAGKQLIEVYLRVNQGIFDGTTFSLFRNVLDPTVRDYGWSLNYGFNNPKEGGLPICRENQPREDCMMTFDSNWRTDPHSPLKIGDKVELAPAPRLKRDPVADGGGSRYYSFEQLYVVGVGMRPWYGIAPNLDSEPLPDDALLGGQASLSYNYSEEPMRVFQQMANNIGITNTQRFVEGRRLFHTSFADGTHSEHDRDNPVFTAHIGQLGARYNQPRCIECHTNNGRSKPLALGAKLDTMSFLTANSDGTGPDPVYGHNVQQHAQDAKAAAYDVTVQSLDTTVRTLPDGEKVELVKPVFAFKGPAPARFSARQAAQVIGMGLLEAIPETTILGLADPNDADGDGVRGVANLVVDPQTGKTHVGRFGWKASKGSIRQQVADALIKDLGVTSPMFPDYGCQRGAANCHTVTTPTSISENELQRMTHYLSLIAVPAQRKLRSGFPDGIRVSPEHDVNPAQIARGSDLFTQVRCVACHTPTLKTGSTHPFAELREQTIHPYTDLLLHDMGPELADSLPEGRAYPGQWRTAPLWGIGSLRFVQGGDTSVRLLHDGRARTIPEAVLWHGGEATDSRTRYEALPKADRDAITTFLQSL